MEKDYRFERFLSLLADMLLKYSPQVLEEQCETEQSTQEEQK